MFCHLRRKCVEFRRGTTRHGILVLTVVLCALYTTVETIETLVGSTTIVSKLLCVFISAVNYTAEPLFICPYVLDNLNLIEQRAAENHFFYLTLHITL